MRDLGHGQAAGALPASSSVSSSNRSAASVTCDRTREGGYTLAQGETLTFGYRAFIHEGETAREEIESRYANFAARQAP